MSVAKRFGKRGKASETMKIFHEPLVVQLNGLKLDCLSQPEFTNISVNFRAESDGFIIYIYWIPMKGVDGLDYTLGIGIDERESLAKREAVAVVGFYPDDKVPDFFTALKALKVEIPKDYIVLV